MPRTKARKKSSVLKKVKHSTSASEALGSRNKSSELVTELVCQEYESKEEFKQEFEKYYDNLILEYQKGYERTCEVIKETIRQSLQELPAHLHHMNIKCDVGDMGSEEDQNKDPNKVSKGRPSRPRKAAEYPEFKKPKTPRISSLKRSASATAAPLPQTSQVFKTPVMNNRRLPSQATITPKIYSNTPMTVMRRPLHGEVAISMAGSPLMVGAVSREDIPTVNVPLLDGRMFSIMPEAGAPPEDLPQFDEITKQHLKTLRAHLEILAPNSP